MTQIRLPLAVVQEAAKELKLPKPKPGRSPAYEKIQLQLKVIDAPRLKGVQVMAAFRKREWITFLPQSYLTAWRDSHPIPKVVPQ